MKNPSGHVCYKLLLGLLTAGLATLGAAAQPRAGRLDSLRQLRRWPLRRQLVLARARLTDYAGPAGSPVQAAAVADQLTQEPARLDATVYLELLGNLAGYYLHQNQPSLAMTRLLEVRQRAWPDSARSANAAIWLSYCCQQLHQPRTGLTYGREAVRRLPRHASNRATELGQAYRMLASCAELLPDYPLQARCYRLALAVARQAGDTPRVAVAFTNLAETARQQQRYQQAASLLDSSLASYNPRAYPALLGMQHQLAARLALHQHRYRAAEQELTALRPYLQDEPLWEVDVLTLLVPALVGQGRYREALASQQRLTGLQATTFEQNANRHAQELEVRYATARREQQLGRQRQRIALLQAQAQLRTAQYGRRLAALGAAALAGGLLLTLGLVWWAGRQRYLRTQREALLRSRIAADLHDEVGTLLARVSMQADLLSQQQPGRDPALARLLGNSRAAASTMRDIVWSIDAQADTAGALLDRIRDYLDELAVPPALQVQLRTDGLHDTDPLPPELRQQVYLIFKEAVTNALRHAAGATCLGVALSRHAGHLELLIENDGPVAAAPGRSGLGLRSMQQRAASLHARLVAGPRPGGGFRVQLTVPAQ